MRGSRWISEFIVCLCLGKESLDCQFIFENSDSNREVYQFMRHEKGDKWADPDLTLKLCQPWIDYKQISACNYFYVDTNHQSIKCEQLLLRTRNWDEPSKLVWRLCMAFCCKRKFFMSRFLRLISQKNTKREVIKLHTTHSPKVKLRISKRTFLSDF